MSDIILVLLRYVISFSA